MTDQSHTMADPEVEALNKIIATLEGLDEAQRGNVLLYVNARYGGRAPARGISPAVAGNPPGEVGADPTQFAHVGDLFDAANPQSEADRVLVVAYWQQVVEGEDNFEAAPVSKELKHLGHGVSNITRALGSLTSQSPRLVLQVAKSGRARQARKRYKLTREGIRRVQAMINDGQGEGNVG